MQDRHTHDRDGQEILGRLLLSERAAGFEQLLAGIAHAFNNALVAIQGANDLATAQVPPDSPVHRELTAVSAAVNGAKEIVNQLVIFSGGGSYRFAPVDLTRSLEALVRVLRMLTPERIRISFTAADGLPPARADELAVKRLVTNLVTNAREAITGEGRIELALDLKRFDGPPAPAPGSYLRLAVTDNGAGIEPEDLPRIFDPFFSRKRGGLGLGLATAYVAAHRHEGFITVESRPGRGSTFTLHLPAAAEATPPATAGASLDTLKGAGVRILIVEDEREVVGFVTRALQRYGYDVTVAQTCAEARALFNREAGRFNLLFCDVALPDGDGFSLAAELLERAPGLAVLMTSGYVPTFPAAAERHPFLRKPYGVTDLLAALRGALDRPAAS